MIRVPSCSSYVEKSPKNEWTDHGDKKNTETPPKTLKDSLKSDIEKVISEIEILKRSCIAAELTLKSLYDKMDKYEVGTESSNLTFSHLLI